MQKIKYKPRSIYLTLSVIMVGLVAALYVILITFNYYVTKQRLLMQASDLFAGVLREAGSVVEGEMRPARIVVSMFADTPLLSDKLSERTDRLAVMAGSLRANPALSAVYGGSPNGSFLLLRSLPTPELRQKLQAPAGAAFLLQSVDRGGVSPQGLFSFYDDQLTLLQSQPRPDYQFDPRSRPWFSQALAVDKGRDVVQTEPYLFFTTGEVGMTMARAGTGSQSGGVAGVDLSLQALSQTLARQKLTPGTELMIVDGNGAVLAYSKGGHPPPGARKLPKVSELGSPVLTQLWQRGPAASGPIRLEDTIMNVGDEEWVVRQARLPDIKGQTLTLAVATPREELQGEYIRSRRIAFMITGLLFAMMLPVTLWTAGMVSRPLVRLAREADAIRRFELDGPDPARSAILEIDRLSFAMTGMKHSLKRFLDISSALSAERNFDKLLDRILVETISVTQASGGSLHLLSSDGQWLEPVGARMLGEPIDNAALHRWPVDEPDSPAAAVQAMRQSRTVEMDLRREDPVHLAAYARIFGDPKVTRVRMLALPLKNRQDQLIGTLSLGFAGQGGEAVLSPSLVAFIEALSGTAAVAIDNQMLLRAQKDLLESLIQLVAGAIDAKSHYTGGHCQRVPELTKMLARAACEATSGPFAGFSLNEEQWEALHIGGWLHDCGKVTTPEFVVDKATKLETIYDRIHEVRMRFEVLKRDAHIQLLERGCSPAEIAQIQAELAPLWAELDEEFAFIAACNEGGEFMAPDKIERLKKIATRSWQRTLDDNLGLSIDEKKRRAGLPLLALPVTEQLLADKPEHVVPRAEHDRLPTENPWGFKLKEPEHLYNRGELYNLTIARGTLTEEERYKINDHIVQTIKMLEALPFPRHLRRVPEIAGGHHEKMDGTGYPRRLTREQMSPEARMMAIADVFEALTADDRPYKKGKTLSEAMKIMGFMRRDKHIDPDLFELFLRSGVYLEYARRFMRPEQLDAIRIEDYLG
jgi:HD-GYP domain-containing protein (c-di-GMP phosphodiesterase class II)